MRKGDLKVGLKVRSWSQWSRDGDKSFSADEFTVLSDWPHWSDSYRINFTAECGFRPLKNNKFSRARSIKWDANTSDGGFVLCEDAKGKKVLKALGGLEISSVAEAIIEEQKRAQEARRKAAEEAAERRDAKKARDVALKAAVLNALGLSEDDEFGTFGDRYGKVTVTVEALVKAGVLDIDASLLDN